MAKNDWIVAGLNNPDFTNSDFTNIADMTVDNTQLLSRDEYLKSNFIRNNPIFADANGKFSEQKFTDYYQKRVQDFGEFQQGDYYQGPALDMFDIDRTPETKTTEIGFNIGRGVNPERQSIGITGVNIWDDPMFSKRELAKQNRVYDTEAGRYRDYTVNEHTLFSNPIEWLKDQFRDPLVMAQWDEDGMHLDPFTGTMKEHKKGDYKLNDKGTYYYETLGGRSVIGKDVLSTFDTFTVDGSGLNKYDFFDSNDIEKSVGGTIAKNIATLIPLFCGPTVASIYSGILVTREFAKSLPMLYGMVTAFSDAQTPSWINNLAAKAEQATSSTSDHAQEKTFAFENFGNLISDVALQWGQQKFVAKGWNAIKGTPDYVKQAELNAKALYDAKKATMGESAELWQVCLNKYLPKAQEMASKAGAMGRDMSLAYMAIISNTDVYASALEHGTTKKEAAAIALGSTLGMFGVDKYLHLGEIFFDEATPDAVKLARQALRNEIRQARSALREIGASAETPQTNKLLSYIKQGANIGKKVFSKFGEDLKYHTLNMQGKMIGEGLEEVSEELVADMSKQLYELAGAFGVDTSVKDIGAWDNAFERYTMNFLGGAIGGGVFYGKEVWDGKKFHKPKLDEDIATLIRNGHVDELRNQLQRMYNEGKTGSKSLSATEYETDSDNKTVWRTTDDQNKSQAKVVADLVLDRINSIEEVITGNRVGLSDDELFENMVLSEKRYNKYKEISGLTNYYQDYTTVLQDYVNSELAYKRASNTLEGTVDGTAIPNDTALNKLTDDQKQARQDKLDELKNKIDVNKQKLDDFLSGETSLDYTRKLNFAMDSNLHAPFLEVSLEEFVEQKFPGKTLDTLDPVECLKLLSEDWPQYVQTQLKSRLSEAWDKYKAMEAIVNPHLSVLETEAPAYKAWLENMEKLQRTKFFDVEELYKEYKTENDKMDWETDDEFQNRTTKIIDPTTGVLETDDVFQRRILNRKRRIADYNEQKAKEWADKIDFELQKVGYKVDPIMARTLKNMMAKVPGETEGAMTFKNRLREVLASKISLNPLGDLALANIVLDLKPDLSNLGQIKDSVKSMLSTKETNRIISQISALSDMAVTTITGTTDTLGAVLQDLAITDPDLESYTIQEILDDPDLLAELSDDSRDKVLEELRNLAGLNLSSITGAELFAIATGDPSFDPLTAIPADPDFDAYIDTQVNPSLNTINNIAAEFARNPLVQLQNKLQTSIVNPVGELIAKIAATNGDVISNIEETLNILQNDFDNMNDISQLILDDAQEENLKKAANYMEMLQVYINAASTLPSKAQPIGHNRTINEFAQTHSDKLRNPWNKLPEIPSDYATMYLQAIRNYESQINSWINMSSQNQNNKIRKIAQMDTLFNKAMWGLLTSVNRDFTYNGTKYDLLKGLDSVDTSMMGSTPQVPLYNMERIFFKNIHEIADAQGITVSELVKTSNLLETLVPNLKTLDNKAQSLIGLTEDSRQISDFDKLQYIATILAEDPAVFYKQLQQRVSTDENTAPIPTQEFASRIAQASMSQTFKDIMEQAYSKLDNQETPMLTNTTLLFGVAGAGKTQVVLGSIDSAIKDKEVWVAGPTQKQAEKLQQALSRKSSDTFETLMIKILGKDQYDRIKQDIDSGSGSLSADSIFKLKTGSDDLQKVEIDWSKVTFNTTGTMPSAIYIDEATHLSTVEAMLIDRFAKTVGAQVFMAGDNLQRGFSNETTGLMNIDEGAVWAAKTPELSLSLRDNNLQKFQNNEAVRMLLKQLADMRLNATEADYFGFFDAANNLTKDIHFKFYSKNALNGDTIVSDIDPTLMAKIKAASDQGQSIAFIGSNTSPYLNKLLAAGVNIKPTDVLSLKQMQGQEFDIVITDHAFTKPTDSRELLAFHQTLYSIMTRATSASIFIDKGLSSVIGKSVTSNNESKAPSIKDGIKSLRDNKINILNQLDFTSLTGAPDPGKPGSGTTNPDLDFSDPELKPADADMDAVIDTLSHSDDDDGDPVMGGTVPVTGKDVGTFLVECYGETTYLGVTETTEREYVAKDGTKKKVYDWEVRVPSSPDVELRNLQALVKDGTKATTYQEKLALQQKLYQVKSVILWDHNWSEGRRNLPDCMMSNFNEADWENGTYELEFREADSNDVLPIWAGYGSLEAGVLKGGKRMIANVVFKVKNKRGQICKFDLAGINDSDTLLKNAGDIKNGIQRRIADPRLDDATKDKLRTLLSTFDNDVAHYRTWFEDRVRDFLTKGNYSLDVTKAISKNKMTMLRKRSTPIRLGDAINIDNIDINDKLNNLKEMNPDKVFSSVYTFTGKEKDFINLDQSLAGRSVVFVSSDCLIKPSDLVKEYIKQKSDPTNHEPRVRMIVLNPVGISFHDMWDPEYNKKLVEAGGKKAPFRMNFLGIQMFTSLWNSRAALMKFTKAVQDWTAANGYSEAQVEAITRAHYMRFKGEPTADIEAFLKGAGLELGAIDSLDKFNSETLKDIPTYRLGYVDNSNGFYIQEFDVKGSLAYSADKAQLLVLNTKKANQFLGMVDSVLQAISPNKGATALTATSSLGLKLLKAGPGGTKVEWGADEFIDLGNPEHRRTLSGALTKERGDSGSEQILVTDPDTGEVLAYPAGEVWSYVPRLLGNIVRTISYYQHNPTATASSGTQVAKLYYKNWKTDENLSLEVNLGHFFGSSGLLNTTGGIDYSLSHMMDLIFHGTIEDFKSNYDADGKFRPVPKQLTDAYFKQGFHIHPDINRTQDSSGNLTGIMGDKELAFYHISTPDYYFLSDVEPRSAGLQLSLADLLGSSTTVPTPPPAPDPTSSPDPGTTPVTVPKQYQALLDLMKSLGWGTADYVYSDSTIGAEIDTFNYMAQEYVWGLIKMGKVKDILKLPFKYEGRDLLTLKEWIVKHYPGAKPVEDATTGTVTFSSEGTNFVLDFAIRDARPTGDSSSTAGTDTSTTTETLFDEKHSGTKTVLDAINEIFTTRNLELADIVTTVQSELDPTYTVDMALADIATVFSGINDIVDRVKKGTLKPEDIKGALQNLYSSAEDGQTMVYGALETLDETLYKKLFEDC